MQKKSMMKNTHIIMMNMRKVFFCNIQKNQYHTLPLHLLHDDGGDDGDVHDDVILFLLLMLPEWQMNLDVAKTL